MQPLTRKRIYIITSVVLLLIGLSAFGFYRGNRSVYKMLVQTNHLLMVNPRKAWADIEQVNRTFLNEKNYMLCDLLKAGALIGMHEYAASDSLLNFVSPYFKYKGDSRWLAEIYYYKAEIARSSNFLLEAIEYYTLCTEYNNDVYDLRELNFYLNNFKGQVYHTKRMKEEEKHAKLEALRLAKELKKEELLKEAYAELARYYSGTDDSGKSIALLKEAAGKGYTGSLQSQLLFLLSEKYADNQQLDSAGMYARQIPHLYQDSVDYLMGRVYASLQLPDSARLYLERSSKSENPLLCLKSYRQLLDLNVRTGSMKGVSDCLAKLACLEEQADKLENKETLSQIENVEKLRKTIRDSEAAEVEYYQYWILYFWIMVAAFVCILVLLFVSLKLQKKKKDLQLKRQQARLDALKMQIDPHFIFNNLSILLDLVETGDKAAPRYVKALAKVYRHIVSNVDKNLSTVADELSCLDSYIFLLKIRFGTAIQIDIRVEEASKERRIPPVVLQMLLENAIKHNQASEESPLLIRVYAEGDKLVVENNRAPIASSASTHQIGLRNIRERYLLIGATAPGILENETIYSVTLSTL